jgi:hypothetical protein
MAKKQTRRSISVSRTTYERLKAFCEANNVSMSQFVETRVGDFLQGEPIAPRPTAPSGGGGGGGGGGSRPDPTRSTTSTMIGGPGRTQQTSAPMRPMPQQVPMTSAAARYAVEPPPPIIKPKGDHDAAAPAPIVKTADQIFTF